tara:strand:+ start:73 stop:258 length:186 start_codon:yes stop_codon:yes gene_type:complete
MMSDDWVLTIKQGEAELWANRQFTDVEWNYIKDNIYEKSTETFFSLADDLIKEKFEEENDD